ncbi:threonine dehydratase [Curvivirga sp.]|uniref:threonine dehydratase n=1 Tax=Curvivirga sp. TaxID=2856848 RepID=UPI003B5AFBCF
MTVKTATLSQLESAMDQVHAVFKGTPTYSWPLINETVGTEVWVKHENHTPIGAFKIRGGLIYMQNCVGKHKGVITATRGNHGQSIATSAKRLGMSATIVVPEGNSVEKNAAMKAQGADLVIYGKDFQESAEYAASRAADEDLHMLPSFHELLMQGVGTYALEFFRTASDLDTVYVPIGMGSGITGMISARDALGLKTKIVGVVAEGAPAYALSFAAGEKVLSNKAETLADGMACRTPDDSALAIILAGAERIVTVNDEEIKAAVRTYYTHTHNIAEGAAAAPLAALMQEKDQMKGKQVGVVLSGGNIDADLFASILQEGKNK